MSAQAVLSFFIYSIINAITPGPGNLLALNATARLGWKKGQQLLLGIFTGYYAVEIICALLVYGLNAFLNPAMIMIKYAGVAYILWLAVHIGTGKPDLSASNKPPSFWTGFILQFVNMKIYLFGVTALTGYILPFYSSLSVLLLSEIIIAAIGTVSTLAWAALGAALKNIYAKHYRIINPILALALLECAVSLLLL